MTPAPQRVEEQHTASDGHSIIVTHTPLSRIAVCSCRQWSCSVVRSQNVHTQTSLLREAIQAHLKEHR